MNDNRKAIKKIVRRNSQSLFWGIRFLPKPQREAMYTLYAFFKHLDDVMESNMTMKEKADIINAWREELCNVYDKKVPQTDIGRRIYKNCMRFKLPKEEFSKLIDSLSMDVPNPMVAPSLQDFLAYSRGMSGVVCNLSLRVLGCDDEELLEELSTNLGNAMQITQILRDIKEDAMAGSMYIPREILQEAGVESFEPFKAVTDKNLTFAREEMAKIAEQSFIISYNLTQKLNKKAATAMISMANVYKRYFDIMNKRGWEVISPKPKINKLTKLSLIIKGLMGKHI